MKADAYRSTGWWLAAGGALLLAATYVSSLYESANAIDAAALRVGASAGSLLLGLAVFYLVGFNGEHPARPGDAPASPNVTLTPTVYNDSVSWRGVGELFDAFNQNLSHDSDRRSFWSAFDQFVREMLAKHANVGKVRCFALRPGDQLLHSLSSSGDEAHPISACAGILGHVAANGRAYWSDDASLGEKVHTLARESGDDWSVVWPVRAEGRTIGVIAAGEVAGETDRAAAIFQCLALLWRHAEVVDHLRTARSTDNATGVLTRAEFFGKAAAAVEESGRLNEPVVVTALVLEGLRGLDDKGLWRVRDALVPAVGRRLLEKLRSDDIVGRLSDDRFVVLMRRLDSALGRLIAKQLVQDLKSEISRHEEFGGRANVRLGLAGSGLRQVSLENLLASAWGAVDAARARGVEMYSDADEPSIGGDHAD